jgi:hypothetical protein
MNKPLLLAVLLGLSAATMATDNPSLNKPVLELDGHIDRQYQAKTLSLAELAKLDQVTLKTTTQWEKTPQVWSGVELTALLQTIGAQGTSLRVVCLNDYAVDIPLQDIKTYHPILAYRKNGNLMPVREKGPLIVIWPYDQQPEIKGQQKYHNWAAWQVKEIDVK